MPIQYRPLGDTRSYSEHAVGSWKVLQGEVSGQTHVAYGYGQSQLSRHESCECSVSDALDPRSIDDTTLSILLDAVWAHPINFQLVCQDDEEFSKWPMFELEVFLSTCEETCAFPIF
uniref:AlNc14C1G79 protein n=1 Tax=Albugo laibachii Nc14 TaxID=890382 RepID=F0VYS7_9STRA|nr:AlNc14C1G79 [Albugo laibachii Nc14]|eukprot:CCA13942.1 AlNc14C1G79 [Albugo laibachii Nc14]